MNKILFGTTALVGLVALSGVAEARDLKLGFGGRAHMGVAFGPFNNETGNPGGNAESEFHIIRDGEIQFKARGTLDNGIKIEARFELDGVNETDQIDENWVEVTTAFGSVLVGANDDAAFNVGGVGIAKRYVGLAVQDERYDFTRVEIDTIGDVDNIAIHYYTPNISGFEAGISYTNDLSSDGTGDDETTGADNGDDQIAVGAAYERNFGDFDFAIGGGYIYSDRDGGAVNNDYAIGVEVGFSGFTLSGRYEFEDSSEETGDQVRFGGGVDYETGPWNFGLAAFYEETEDGGEDQEELAVLGAVTYELGDGVTVGGAIEYGRFDDDGADAENDIAGALLLEVAF